MVELIIQTLCQLEVTENSGALFALRGKGFWLCMLGTALRQGLFGMREGLALLLAQLFTDICIEHR